jgi:rRNA-processing protein FCF1
MRAVIDSSSWISMARAGLLDLLDAVLLEPVLPDVVFEEIVEEGRRGGHADAAALSTRVAGVAVTATPESAPADARVVRAAQDVGILVANDLALGRRARSLGITWVRTADLIVLAVRRGAMSSRAGIGGLQALQSSGRITAELRDAYEELVR